MYDYPGSIIIFIVKNSTLKTDKCSLKHKVLLVLLLFAQAVYMFCACLYLQINEKTASVDVKAEMQEPQFEASPKPQRQQKVCSTCLFRRDSTVVYLQRIYGWY